jgi:hypothetical protein
MVKAERLMQDVRVAIRLLRMRRRRLERALDKTDETIYSAVSLDATVAPTETPRLPETAKESNYFAISKVDTTYTIGTKWFRERFRCHRTRTGAHSTQPSQFRRWSRWGHSSAWQGEVRDSTSSADSL